MKAPIRVCILHRHRLFFEAIKAMLDQHGGFDVVNPASEMGSGALSTLEGLAPFDIALIDAAMDSPDALAVTGDCKRLFSDANVVVVGVAPSEQAILQAIEAGASGYTAQDASCAELIQTIEAVHAGRTPCSPRIAALVFARIAQLASVRRRRAPEQTVHVTAREHEILQLLADGCHNAEIAYCLGITLHTVKNHVHHILSKFQARGRREAIQRAYEHGVLNQPRPSRAPLVTSR